MLMSGKSSDASIVKKVMRGDRGAFRALVERHESAVHGVAYAHLGSHPDADDVTQDTFLKAFQSLAKLRRVANLGPWLVTVARNRSRDILRKRRNEVKARDRIEVVEPQPRPDRQELYRLLWDQIHGLDENAREVLMLHYFSGEKITEIGVLLGISRDAAAKRLQRARTALGRRLVDRIGAELDGEQDRDARTRGIMGAVALASAPWEGAAASAGGSATPALAGWASDAKLGITVYAKLAAVTFAVLLGGAGLVLMARSDVLPWTTGQSAHQATSDMTPISYAYAPVIPEDEDVEKTAERQESAPASVNGTVRLVDGSGVAGAKVAVFLQKKDIWTGLSDGEAVRETRTGPDGTYAVTPLPAGAKMLFMVSAPDWAISGRNILPLTEGEQLDSIDFCLKPPVTASGIVESERGEPIPQANVYLLAVLDPVKLGPSSEGWSGFSYYRSGLGFDARRFGCVTRTKSDANGQFTLTGLPEGYVLNSLGAKKEGYAPGWAIRHASTRELESLGVGGIATWDARYIPLPCEGARLILRPAGEVTGRVVYAEGGAPAGGAEVHIQGQVPLGGYQSPQSSRYESSVVADGAGRFAFAGVPGVGLSLSAVKGNARCEAKKVSVTAGYVTDGIVLEIAAEGAVEGRLLNAATGEPIAGALLSHIQGARCTFEVARADSQGGYRIEDLPPGELRLAPRIHNAWKLSEAHHPEAVESGSWPFKHVPVRSGLVTTGIDLHCEPHFRHTGTVRGRVLDRFGNAAGDAEVYRQGVGSKTSTANDGSYLLEGVLPGEHTLVALDPSNSAYATTSVKVRINEETAADLQLDKASCRIRGRAVKQNGTPCNDPVQIIGLGNKEYWTVYPDAEGFFEQTVLPGRYAVSPAAEGAPFRPEPSQHTVDLSEGDEAAGLDFVLTEMDGFLAGTVSFANGKPAESVLVEARNEGAAIRSLTDSDGRFFLDHIDGDRFDIVVWNPDAMIVWAHAEGTELNTDDWSFLLEEPGRLKGRFAGVQDDVTLLNLRRADDALPSWGGLQTRTGEFEFSLQPGDYILDFTSGETRGSLQVSVLPGETTDLGETSIGAAQ